MTTCLTPMKSAAARCSTARRSARSEGESDRSDVPESPLVHSTYVTSQPAATHFAMTPPDPISASSGWAKITMALSGASVTISSFFRSSVLGDMRAILQDARVLTGLPCRGAKDSDEPPGDLELGVLRGDGLALVEARVLSHRLYEGVVH